MGLIIGKVGRENIQRVMSGMRSELESQGLDTAMREGS
jgi:hypothetical protein